jgi:RNA polymerase sigma-70 factor (ECF subfamily)
MPPQDTQQAHWFAKEVQPHEPALRGYLRGTFPSLPDVDDLVQESYSRLIRAREAGPIQFVKAFLFTTARNVALDLFRRRKIAPMDRITEDERRHVIEDAPGVADMVSRQQELTLLADAIRALPERCRQVLTLRKLYGLSQRDIAQKLGISEHTVEVQVAKGMRRIADHFARHGLSNPRSRLRSPYPRE